MSSSGNANFDLTLNDNNFHNLSDGCDEKLQSMFKIYLFVE